ncbi:DUF1694 domain-containing protein [Vagococcus hydrophili]|uniref:YueI family protein n=1 Tax=Vagococcus hydrophili TaxID=2714947 RepID=A0A6G8AS08_9ENTE|nr:DUF1694 domain-containing protein [Vagococcus hydrophili]QIL47777.1 YueI family protein [Vagococcus hydrophili]
MAGKDVQDYLDNALYGTPQIKPDEQKKYLGTFRERVVFVLTTEEAKKAIFDSFSLKQFTDFPNGTLLIDANCDVTSQNRLMSLAQRKNIEFKFVDRDEDALSEDDIAMVYALSTPINREDISVKNNNDYNKKTTNEPKTETKKTGFFSNLFK